MCIACELGFLIAMDELPDGPPPGFPGHRAPDGQALPANDGRFACDAPAAPAAAEGERSPSVNSRE